MKTAVLVLLSAAAPFTLAAPAPAPSPTGIPSSSTAKTLLSKLPIGSGADIDGYERDKFKTWIQQGDNCDTREYVLKRDGKDVQVNNACSATSGTWTSPYDDKVWTSKSDLQIDHMVPLKNAWNNGAANWTALQRQDYANDITRPQLWAVTSSVNESKGDSSPDEWKPPSEDFFCTYAEAWVEVKSYYALTITEAEKSALSDMLDTC